MHRRNISKFQRIELFKVQEKIISEKAKKNQSEAGGDKKSDQKSLLMNSPKAVPVNTRKEIANLSGVSEDTVRKASEIYKKGTQEQIARARKGGKGNSINVIYTEIVHKDIEEKVCNCCGKKLPITEFYGGRNRCKACTNRIRAGGGGSQVETLETMLTMKIRG